MIVRLLVAWVALSIPVSLFVGAMLKAPAAAYRHRSERR